MEVTSYQEKQTNKQVVWCNQLNERLCCIICIKTTMFSESSSSSPLCLKLGGQWNDGLEHNMT